MRNLSLLLAIASASATSACMVGTDELEEDAVAGQGLGDDDLEGTGDDGSIAARICPASVTTKGIDVSKWQGSINWARVKNAGYAYAFIRVSDGVNYPDPRFATNWANARSAGVIRGAYQFFRPSQNVAAQANLMIQRVGAYRPGDLPPVIDVEADGGLAPSVVAQRVKQWVDLVRAGTGARPIVYTGKYFWRDEVGGSTLVASSPLWIAQYTSLCPDIPAPWTQWKFWQHTDRGRVDGIVGNVDLNKFNGSLAELQTFAANGGL